MTSASHDHAAEPARWSLRPGPPTPSGSVDGAWWPRSRELADELPALLAAVGERLGPVERVSHHLGDWAPAPRRTGVGATAVRIGGYRWQATGTVDLEGPAYRVTLLVVPPETGGAVAERALTTAGAAGNTAGAADLLPAGTP